MFSQKGFSVVEGLLVLVAVSLIGFTGYYVYSSNKATDKVTSSANNAADAGAADKLGTGSASEQDKLATSQTITSSQKHFTFENLYNWPTFNCKDTDGVLLLPKPADGLETNCYTSDLKAPFRDLDHTYQAVIAKGQNPYSNPDLNGDFKKVAFPLNKNIPGEKLTYSMTNKTTGGEVLYYEYLFKINGQEYTAYFFDSAFWKDNNQASDRKDVSVESFEKVLQTLTDKSLPPNRG